MSRLLGLAFMFVIVVAGALVLGTADMLPPSVASHFGPSGVADDWMPRAWYLGLMVALVTLLPAIVAASMGLVPQWTRGQRLMRHPEYWFSPPRRATTQAFLHAFACGLGILLCLFLLGVHVLVVQANASVPARLSMPPFFVLLGGFLAIQGGMLAALFLRFRMPD